MLEFQTVMDAVQTQEEMEMELDYTASTSKRRRLVSLEGGELALLPGEAETPDWDSDKILTHYGSRTFIHQILAVTLIRIGSQNILLGKSGLTYL